MRVAGRRDGPSPRTRGTHSEPGQPTPPRTLFGPAVTIAYLPYRDDFTKINSLAFAGWFYRAVGDTPKGKVLVLSSGGYPDVSHGGGTKLPRVHNHGLAGVLTDGRLRDFGEMAEYDFAAWCGRGHTLGRWHCRPVGGEYNRWRRMCPSRSGGSASLLAITSSPTVQARSSSRSAVCPMSWPRPAVSMQMSRVPFPRSALRPQADAGGRPAGHRSVKRPGAPTSRVARADEGFPSCRRDGRRRVWLSEGIRPSARLVPGVY